MLKPLLLGCVRRQVEIKPTLGHIYGPQAEVLIAQAATYGR